MQSCIILPTTEAVELVDDCDYIDAATVQPNPQHPILEFCGGELPLSRVLPHIQSHVCQNIGLTIYIHSRRTPALPCTLPGNCGVA